MSTAPKRIPLSPRRRRRRWALVWVGLGCVLGGLVAVHRHQQAGRPAPYRPGEQPAGITRTLARDVDASAPQPAFAEVSGPAGLAAFRNFAGHRTSQLPEDMGPGLAWGDFDNDGDDDLFLVSAGGALGMPDEELEPSVLYENLGDGTFRRVEGFPELRVRGLGAAWADYDGDGHLDLVVVGYQALRLLRNEAGSGRFTLDPGLPERPGFWSAAAWADFDQDGRLDLYVCQYVQYDEDNREHELLSEQMGTLVPFTLNPASYPAGRNALFRQNPDGTFTDVAAELGVQNPEGRSLGALWHDFDQDGQLDLYVANDVSDNVFYRNQGGRFEDISHAAWVADYRGAMGLAAGDFDRDGDDDLFVTHWVAQENGLYENLWADLHRRPAQPVNPAAASPDPASGSSSDEPDGTSRRFPLRFVDIADRVGLGQIALPFVGWGTEFADLDQDGWLDLLVANGSTLELEGAPPRRLRPQELFLFWNRQGRSFHNLAPLNPALAEKRVSRGLACADFDLDGDLDFAVADLQDGVRLFRNDLASGNWLKVRLRSRNATGQANGFGTGSTAIAWIGEVPLRRSVTSVSYLSQSSHTLHWGLGDATHVGRFEIRWHGGGTNVVEGLAANAFYEIFEDDPIPRRLAPGSTPAPASAPVARLGSQPAVPVATPPAATAGRLEERERLVRFWTVQRAAMDALMVQQDPIRAIPLFREAIELNPQHQDSRYYLGLSLANQGEVEAALEVLSGLQQLNPNSHRAWQQWGVIRSLHARSDADLAAAEQALEQARAINPDETGVQLLLGEIALLRGDRSQAETRLAAATFTNPRAAGGFFLRAYLAWSRGDAAAARRLLQETRQALGPDWQPEGMTGEGDVKQRHHVEPSPLARHWGAWDGQDDDLDGAFAGLDRRLTGRRPGSTSSPVRDVHATALRE